MPPEKLTPEEWDSLPDWARERFADQSPYLSERELRARLVEITVKSMQVPASAASVSLTWLTESSLSIDVHFGPATGTPDFHANVETAEAAREQADELTRQVIDLLGDLMGGINTADPDWRTRYDIAPL